MTLRIPVDILIDIECLKCGHECEDFTVNGDKPLCPLCGGDVVRVWRTPPKLDYLHMGVDSRGLPTAGEKWARMHEQAAASKDDG